MSETKEEVPSKETSATAIISEQERELSQNALADFQKCQYSSCLANLNKLEILRPKDLKVTHNKVVVEYYKTDLKKTELMKKSLNAISGHSKNHESSSPVDDVEKCVLRYNQAVLLYHTKEYQKALQIMKQLFASIDPLEESLQHKICLLLVELHIATNQLEAALVSIRYIDSRFIMTDSKITSNDKEGLMETVKEQKEQKKDVDAATDAFRRKLYICKIRIHLLMYRLKSCSEEWKTAISYGMPMNLTTTFLRANLEYLRGDHKKAIQLLNSETSGTPDFRHCGESAAVYYYNNMACIHHAMGKPNLACFYLRKALDENQKVIENGQDSGQDRLSSQPLYTLSGNKYYDLMFSLGICLLHSGQPMKALDCFTEAAQKLHNDPKIWIHMAECCIYSHKNTNEDDFNIPKRSKDLVQKVVGTKPYRKIVLTPSLSKNAKYHASDFSYAIPQPTLKFGMLCLKNALFLLPNDNEINQPFQSPSTLNKQSVPTLSATPSKLTNANNSTQHQPSQSTTIEALNLKISVLANSAYVSLCLGDYVLALEYAKSLLSINKIPEAYRMLGHLYAAESLIFLDKINEAIEYLKLENLQNLETSLPIVEPEEKNEIEENAKPRLVNPWFPDSVLTAAVVLKYNLAVAYAIRGELSKSKEILKKVWVSKGVNCRVPIHLIMLALYIELQLGHADVSKAIIKQHCPIYR